MQTDTDTGDGWPTAPSPLTVDRAYVLNRPDDLVLLIVHFANFLPATPPESAATLTAIHGSYLIVVFPIQAFFEQRPDVTFDWPEIAFAGSWPASPSKIRLEVSAGTVIPLTVADILAAIELRPITSTTSVPNDRTAIDMPAGLILTPLPAQSGEAITASHPTSPRRNGDITALWQSELSAPSGLEAIGLLVYPDGDVPGDTQAPTDPLDVGQRNLILELTNAADEGPAQLDRLRLSALGGTMTAHANWTTASWQQDIALGRDHRVQMTELGVLLPFGHKAVLVELAERNVEDAPDGGLALLRTRTTLFIDPVRQFPNDDTALARQFPFDRVDILTPVVDNLKTPVPAAVGPLLPMHFTPTLSDGTAVKFPVRLYGAQGPVDVATQMIFVGNATRPAVGPADAPAPTPPPKPGHVVVVPGADTTPQIAEPAHGVHRMDVPDLPLPFMTGTFSVPTITVPAARIDLVRDATNALAADVHVVHSLTLTLSLPSFGASDLTDPSKYRPAITALRVDLPAVKAFLPPNSSALVDATLSPDLIANGSAANAVLSGLTAVDPDGAATLLKPVMDFSKSAQQTGALVNPNFVADTIGRKYGPIANDLLQSTLSSAGMPDLASTFKDAKLLGLSLVDLLPKPADLVDPKNLPVPPMIVEMAQTAEEIASSTPPTVQMTWSGLKPLSKDSFLAEVAGTGATLDLEANVGPDTSSVTCTLTNFTLSLPDMDSKLLTLAFDSLVFTAVKGSPPKLQAKGVHCKFGGAMALIQTLENAVDLGGAGQLIKATGDGITVSYALSVPEVAAGMFDLRNIDFASALTVPFNGDPVSLAANFASRDNPFTLAVLAFGGGGYINLLVNGRGLQHFEGSLDFGAQLAVNFVVAAGEVHAFGGVSFLMTPNDITVSAFLRFGGSLQILGLITVSVEVSIDLTYADSKLTGSAKLVIDVDITIWSDSVEIDTGTWTIVGGGDSTVGALDSGVVDPTDQLAAWRQYREAFAA